MSHLDQATLFFHSVSPAEKRIFKVLSDLEKKKRIDPKFNDINPTRKTLGYQAQCSESSVKKLLKKFTGTLVKVTTRKKANGYNTSNIYKLDEDFFGFMVLMDSCGFFKNSNRFKEMILQGLGEDEDFLYKKWMKIHKLSTMNVPAEMLQNVPALKIFLKRYRNTVPKNSAVYQQIKEIKEKEGFRILCSANLTFSEKERLSNTFAAFALREAMENYRFIGAHKIITPCAFLYSKAREHTIKKFNYIRRI